MPSIRHEATATLLRRNLQLAPYLLACAGYDVSEGTAVLADSSLPDETPREWRADVVTVTSGTGGKLAIVCEPQTSRPKPKKWWSWLAYIAAAGAHHECPVVVMAITLSQDIARRCARTFSTGHPDLDLTLVVSGSHNTPHPDAPGAEHVSVELAVLSALNGNLDLTRRAHRRYLICKLLSASESDALLYNRYIYLASRRSVRKALEEDMKTLPRVPYIDDAIEQGFEQGRAAGHAKGHAEGHAEGRAEGHAEGHAEGRAEGARDMLFRLLRARGFTVPAGIRRMVEACTDVVQLDEWGERTIDAKSLEDVFI
jgi:hypothetical protein